MTSISSAHYHIGSGEPYFANNQYVIFNRISLGFAIAWSVYGPSFGAQKLKNTWQDDDNFLRLTFVVWAVGSVLEQCVLLPTYVTLAC